jgi:hypothetical protein
MIIFLDPTAPPRARSHEASSKRQAALAASTKASTRRFVERAVIVSKVCENALNANREIPREQVN